MKARTAKLPCQFPGCTELLTRVGYCVAHRNPLWRMQHELNPATHAPGNGFMRRPLKVSK